jgi:hypothetical protein
MLSVTVIPKSPNNATIVNMVISVLFTIFGVSIKDFYA